MRRSASFINPGSSCHAASVSTLDDQGNINYGRHIYINTEEANKEKHTIFHSPYKGGRKNPNYYNPTFMSSDIFYPMDYSHNSRSKSKPKLGLVPSKNHIGVEQQWKSRTLNRSLSGSCLNHTMIRDRSFKKLDIEILSKIQEQIRKQKQQMDIRVDSKVARKHEENRQLRKQLETMKKSPSRKSNNRLDRYQTPIYLEVVHNVTQNRHSLLNRVLKKQTSKKELVNEMSKALKRKIELWEGKVEEKRNQKRMIDQQNERFQAVKRSTIQFDKKKARLLNELLIEQILYKN